jgi:hypothetical protein
VVLATPGAGGCSHRLLQSVLQHGEQTLDGLHYKQNRRTFMQTDHHLSTNKLQAAETWKADCSSVSKHVSAFREYRTFLAVFKISRHVFTPQTEQIQSTSSSC